MNLIRIALLSGLVALLQACASVPAGKPVDHAMSQALYQQHLQNLAGIGQFTLQGRIGVQAEGKGFSGSLNWQHNPADDEIALYSPLGGQVASIKKTADEVTLIDAKGKRISAADTETLTQNTLGWKLPLTGLADWSIGRPTSSAVQASTLDEKGRLLTLKQDGWDIEYQNYSEQNGHFLPGKIVLRSEKLNLKLLIEKWLIVKN
ncbi:MAG: outer membrane lipoprotein LolB [Betaproteobacteria bacterium HGW-Betaproteobacteria-20]|nr:MAG: outer membrane lipoprotein LolB [Betaproteobacteria bacterium HGW-Betaproteobacteria-20]